MRIISGKFKGHKLNIPKNFLIRPTTDRLKESLFSIINSEKYSSNIDGKYFLDLCSGSGGIGIEAFSRGAKKVYMIDKNQNAINLILGNICCHKSIRSGRILNLDEMNALLREMEVTPNSGQCNHGRPTTIALSVKQIEKLFERI